CYPIPFSRGAREILNNRIVQLELALLYQQHDRGCGELLSHGGKLKYRVWGDWRIMLEVSNPIAIHLDDFAIFDDYESKPWNASLLHLNMNVFISGGGGERRIEIPEPALFDRDVVPDLIKLGDEHTCRR